MLLYASLCLALKVLALLEATFALHTNLIFANVQIDVRNAASGEVTLPINNISPNSFGTKFFHPTLSSEELLDAAILASAVYERTPTEFSDLLNSLSATGSSPWINVTDALTDEQYGLDVSLITSDLDDFGYFRTTTSYLITPTVTGTPEAYFLRNIETGQYAIAFRGTAQDGGLYRGDQADWFPGNMEAHYDAFEPFLDAVDAFLACQGTLTGNPQTLLVTGHSLGGAMVEYYMAEHPDNNTITHSCNGVTYAASVDYEALAIASPEANFGAPDPRTLNIGHQNDIVYGAIGGFDADVSNVFISGVRNIPSLTHPMASTYLTSISTILNSDYYSTTSPSSRVLINFAETPQESQLLSRDSGLTESLILGRDSDITRVDGALLSVDDYLFGAGQDDIYEGFSGNDVYFVTGGGGSNTFSMRHGEDTIVVSDRFQLRDSTIDGLGVGDKIAFFDETTRGLSQGDISVESGKIIIDGGLIFSDVEINGVLPLGTELRLVEGSLPIPDFNIPLYNIEKYLEVVLTPDLAGPYGPTTLSPARDFYVGTTEEGLLSLEWLRSGDLTYEIDVLNDGTTLRPADGGFQDSVLTMPANLGNFQSGGVDLRGLRGSQEDVLIEVKYSVSPSDSPLSELVEFTTDTVRYLFIGDAVDDRGGRAWGNPQLITFDNVAYDFHASGEFILARATSGPAYEVQIRIVELSSAVSVIAAIATVVDDTTIAIEANGAAGRLLVAGVDTALADGDTLTVGSGSVTRTGNTISIDHGNGDTTSAQLFSTFLGVTSQPSLARTSGTIEGLLGNANGTPLDDFRLTDGTVLTTPIPIDVLYGDFSAGWIVPDGERLLPGPREAFEAPDRIVTIDSLPAGLRANAEAAVDARGITNPIVREAAILDFALTGNEEFIEAAVQTDQDFNPIVDTNPVDPVSNSVVILTADTTTLDEEYPTERTATLTVSRGSTEGDLTVNWSIVGAGVKPASADDIAGGIVSGSVAIADGAENATFTVAIENDNFDEGPETFDVAVALEPEDADDFEVLISSVRLTVTDNDTPPPSQTFSIASDVTDIIEGDAGQQTVSVTITRDQALGAAVVTLTLTGTADAADRALASESVSFEADETEKVVQLTISGDIDFEPDETVIVSIDSISEFAIVGTRSTTLTITNDDSDVPVGTDGPDDIFNPLGGQSFALGGGADVIRGPVENFFDDFIDGFGLDDTMVFEGAKIARSAIDVTFGSAIFDIDTDGDDNSNGQFTLEGDFSAGDFMAVGESGDTLVTFEIFLPVLQERQAVDPDLVNGIINQNFLKGDGTTDFQVTLRDLGFAGYNNVVGVYEIDAAGNIVDTRILFENANADKSASTLIEDVEDGHTLGFFIVQDAADWAATLAAGDTLSFVNSSGAAANVSDGANISIALNGGAVDEMVFHSFDENMNSDGLQHALSGVDIGGEAITIGFEDLTGGGDRDYEDVAFRVELVEDFLFF